MQIYEINELPRLIANEDIDGISSLMKQCNLEIKNNTIVAKYTTETNEKYVFWDKRQLVKKINLNS
jgi:hypothetical protein